MKTIFAALLMLATLLGYTLKAEEKTNGWPSVTLTTTAADKYLAFGNGIPLYENPVIQSDIFAIWKNGLYAVIWNSTGFDSKWNNNLGDEVDYGVGWTHDFFGLNLNIGSTYFDEPKVFTLGAGDILYNHARITKDFKHLSVFVGFENYITMPNSGFEGGNLVSLGATKALTFWNGHASFNNSLAIVYDDGIAGYDNGFLLRGTTGLGWNLTKRLVLNLPSINYYVPFTPDGRKIDAVFMVSLSCKLN